MRLSKDQESMLLDFRGNWQYNEQHDSYRAEFFKILHAMHMRGIQDGLEIAGYDRPDLTPNMEVVYPSK